MKWMLIAGAAEVLLLWPAISTAYQPGTHATLSDQAAVQSVLVKAPSAATGATTVLQDLGLSTYADQNQTFPFAQGGEPIPDSTVNEPTGPQNIQALIRAGATLEDEGLRPLNHFYDPINKQALTILHVPLGSQTPSWAEISTCNSGTEPGPYDPADSSFIQCFSLQDAMSFFRYALTAGDPNVRSQQFGDLFLTLGHVMHLVQDMAQPQHVRNDMHCDSDVCLDAQVALATQGVNFKIYSPSAYEEFAGNQLSAGRVSNLQAYPVVNNLTTANSYWTTGTGTSSGITQGEGQGLADYTNLNFVSIGTNFTFDQNDNPSAGPYQNPVPLKTINIPIDQLYAPNQLYSLNQVEPTQIQKYCAALPNSCMVSFVDAFVMDHLNPALNQDDPYASSYSIFDQDLQNFNACAAVQFSNGQVIQGCRLFTLNNFNYAVDENLLLPRAVGYSAGLINYFFRGKLGVQPDPNNIDNYIVSNLSSYELKGSIEFYYDDPDGNRYPITGSKTTVDLPGLASGSQTPSTQSIQVVPPAYPQGTSTGSYMAVFDGTIGTEPGIAGKQVQADKFYVTIDEPGGTSPFFHCEDGTVQTYTSAGILANESDSGMPLSLVDKVAVVGGAVFSSFPGLADQDLDGDGDCGGGLDYGDTSGVSDGPARSYVMRNGQVFLTLPEGPNFIDFAMSDKNLFALSSNPQSSATIDIYDLAGNVAAATATLNPHFSVAQDSVNWVAANDSVICVTGDDSSDNAEDLLYSLNGTLIATLTGHPGDDDYCGASANRIYIARSPDKGPYYVDVYDNNGMLITSIPLDAGASPYGVAATDTRVYVLYSDNNGPNQAPPDYGYEQGVAIYQRSVGNGPDTFTLLRKALIKDANLTTFASGIAVDMQAVLNAPAH